MRVTHKLMNENAVRYMEDGLQRLYALQEKVAAGKEFQRASDNPAAASASLSLRSSLETNKAYLETAQIAESWLSATDFSLRQMIDVGIRAMNLNQEGASDTLGPTERKALAAEMDGLLGQAIDIANASHQGSYIFAGYKTTKPPFSALDATSAPADPGEEIQGIDLSGDDGGSILRNIGPGQSIMQNINGGATFKDLLQGIINARNALQTNDEPGILSGAGALESALETVKNAVSTNGARQRQVQQSISRAGKTQVELKSLLSQKEDANMAEAISALRQQETVYQAVLEVGHRAISALNLFDMMG